MRHNCIMQKKNRAPVRQYKDVVLSDNTRGHAYVEPMTSIKHRGCFYTIPFRRLTMLLSDAKVL